MQFRRRMQIPSYGDEVDATGGRRNYIQVIIETGDEVEATGGRRNPVNVIIDGGDAVEATGGSRNFANVYLDRVRLAGLSDTVKFEVKKIKEGGKKSIFKQKFEVREGEKLLKASHCCLSTQVGTVAGVLFISTERIAFYSQRSITFNLPYEPPNETYEKMEIPLRNIRPIILNEPQLKKIIIIREDGSEFQFKDFLRYEKARQNLLTAIQGQTLRN